MKKILSAVILVLFIYGCSCENDKTRKSIDTKSDTKVDTTAIDYPNDIESRPKPASKSANSIPKKSKPYRSEPIASKPTHPILPETIPDLPEGTVSKHDNSSRGKPDPDRPFPRGVELEHEKPKESQPSVLIPSYIIITNPYSFSVQFEISTKPPHWQTETLQSYDKAEFSASYLFARICSDKTDCNTYKLARGENYFVQYDDNGKWIIGKAER